MTSTTTTKHAWTPDDDGRLEAAVTALAAADLRKVRLWDAVCGRLAPEIACTPQAAKSRYHRLVELRREAKEQEERRRLVELAEQAALARVDELDAAQREAEASAPPAQEAEAEDSWERLARRIEQYEADQGDRLEAAVERLEAAQLRIEADLATLLGMWQ